jgi:hypothetical protein
MFVFVKTEVEPCEHLVQKVKMHLQNDECAMHEVEPHALCVLAVGMPVTVVQRVSEVYRVTFKLSLSHASLFTNGGRVPSHHSYRTEVS